jgi:soluble lytic murein transglycosylase-like protein
VREVRRRLAGETKVALFAAVSRCRQTLTERERWRIAEAIQVEAERHGYDPMFVMAIIEVESTCSPTARGPGGVGLIQIKPSTARAVALELGMPWDGRTTLVEPKLNVRLGLTYLSQMLDRFQDPYVAIAAYNRGPARANQMSRQRAKQDRYVKKVLARYENLLDEHA